MTGQTSTTFFHISMLSDHELWLIYDISVFRLWVILSQNTQQTQVISYNNFFEAVNHFTNASLSAYFTNALYHKTDFFLSSFMRRKNIRPSLFFWRRKYFYM